MSRVAKKTAAKKEKNTLVLVESPAKAKTIEKYLGKGYVVKASMGHLRDLPKSQFGIDVENNFEPKYINIRGKGELIRSLKKEANKANKVYLASDPDREGEAIAWHLAHIFSLEDEEKCRIVFNEITKNAIKEAVKNPKQINMDMVDAQQARRLLDRIVGYKLSPLLWRKVKKGLSAGRVQSVTMKLICDREKKIKSFVPKEYWTIALKLKKGNSSQFMGEVTHVSEPSIDRDMLVCYMPEIEYKKLPLPNEKMATWGKQQAEAKEWQVAEIKKHRRQRKPMAPFTTSSLQQDAARKLGFTSKKTMMLAQQLYEGLELGRKGATGLITYMRTDSVRISEVAQEEAKEYILANYGQEYYPKKANSYITSKKAQDAHEAIRPTSAHNTPDSIKKYLTDDQLKLYTLIWQRFLASPMKPAVFDTVAVKLTNELCKATTSGSRLIFPGFQVVYSIEDSKEKDVLLPDLQEGDKLKLMGALPKQHFTEAPARYNDASLVKLLEEKAIGRPSTYATIIETLLSRGYVLRSKKTFIPTELGFIVVDMLEEYFKDIVDEAFTASMEGKLDSVAEGTLDKNTLLKDFYIPFEETLNKADMAIGHVDLPVEESDVPCDICGRMMVIKLGRYGKFLACPGFPGCRNTKPLLKETGATCPECGGSIIERRFKKAQKFYGCKNYPECNFVTWDVPQVEKCPECGGLQLKHFYRSGKAVLYCINDACITRKDHEINKELEKQRKKREKQENGKEK